LDYVKLKRALKRARSLRPYIGRPRLEAGPKAEKKPFLRPMRARGGEGYICIMNDRRNQMNVTMVERNCADCLLRMLDAMGLAEAEGRGQDLDPENAPERQLEQLERSFGTNWKW
jgi:hypothetical protein